MKTEPTFLVDKAGLAKLVADRPKAFILYELVQNAWDEASTKVDVFAGMDGPGKCRIEVMDDNPEGFADLTHAYTLFAESAKKDDPTKRGRFNLGEKLVIALAEEAMITTTKGTVHFKDGTRRHIPRQRREQGTHFIGTFRMTKREFDQMCKDAELLLPPWGIETRFNARSLTNSRPFSEATATLPTVRSDDEGNLRATRRQTKVVFHEVQDGERAMLYELGIPVVTIDCGFHVNVQQKVPLNADRDNVTPAYLREIQTITLNQLAADVKGDAATKGWVNDALESKNIDNSAVATIIKERYGDKVVIFDPSDREGTDLAVSKGYTVLPPRTFSHDAWVNVKAAGILPAGQVTPSPKPYAENGRPEVIIDYLDYTPEMVKVTEWFKGVGEFLLDHPVAIKVVKEPNVDWQANYGAAQGLTLNKGKLYSRFWDATPGSAAHIELALHEYAHEREANHLSMHFADEVARLGAKLMLFAAGKPYIDIRALLRGR